jgi:hypothetical protein
VHQTENQLYLILMEPKLGLREKTTGRESQSARFRHSGFAHRGGALLCVLLVFLTSFVAVAHFHTNELGNIDHSCSLCALAHAGVAVSNIAAPTPIFAPSILAETPAIVSHSFLPVSSNYIRPPPQA